MAVPAAEELAALLAEAWEDISLPTSIEEAQAAAAEHIANGSRAAVVEVSNAAASRIQQAARSIGGAVGAGMVFHDEVKAAYDDVKKRVNEVVDFVGDLRPTKKQKQNPQKKKGRKRKRSRKKKQMHRRIEPLVSEGGPSMWGPSNISFSSGTSFFNLP